MKIINKKEQQEIMSRLTANYIIGADAVRRSNLDEENKLDALKHLFENMIAIARLIGKGDEMLEFYLGYSKEHKMTDK